MTIVDRIIKFLGGFTNSEQSVLESEYNHQRDQVQQSRARIEYLEKELAFEREERKYLQELIFTKFGITPSKEDPQNEEELKPIRTSPQRWSGLKNRLEKDDIQRVYALQEKS